MSRNGSGVYNLPSGNPVVSGTTITTTWANTTLSDIASSLTGSVASDGQTPMSGNLNLANNKILNVTDPTTAQDAATKAYVDTADTANLALSLLKTSNLSDVANATTSRTNLVAAKSGANSDITSITGLTTPLTVAQGGIGVATLTANNVLLGNGTTAPLAVAPSTSGNVLTSNGTTWTSATPATSLPGVLSQVFTASGTFTIPTGVSAIKVTIIGGGGGGGGYRAACSSTAGSGGGGAALSVQYFTGLTPANTLTVTVGAAGTAGVNQGNGTAGGTSSIASGTQTITTASANGGGAGIGASASNATTFGAAGAASTSGVAYSLVGYAGTLPYSAACVGNVGGNGGNSSQLWGNGGVGFPVTAGNGYGSGGYGGGFIPGSTSASAGKIGLVIVEW